MIIIKERLEYETSSTNENELYFSLFQILLIGCLIYISANWIFNKWKEYKLLKNEKLEAELINLKNQISPHFLFNTLNNLYGLIKKDVDKAQDFVLKLSDLLRYSIYSGDHEKVSINEEVTYIENFISLHQIRHFKNVDIQFIKDIKNEHEEIHSLLLIIFVENAFKHGIGKLVDDAFIHCSLNASDKKLRFTVTNNFDNSSDWNGNGVGLSNLRRRLLLLYPEKHQLEISQEKNIFKASLEIVL